MYCSKFLKGPLYFYNPWKGCSKVSEGCQNCFIRNLNNFVYNEEFLKLPTTLNEHAFIIISLATDFFLEEAEPYIKKVWKIVKEHPNNTFCIITKRPERIITSLPDDWGEGYDNVIFDITCENQKRADERIPILKDIPCKHKWITVTPMLEKINIEKYLDMQFIEAVECAGEKGYKARELHFDWVEDLSNQCKKYNTSFYFLSCGHRFEKNGNWYKDTDSCYHSYMADACKVSYEKK